MQTLPRKHALVDLIYLPILILVVCVTHKILWLSADNELWREPTPCNDHYDRAVTGIEDKLRIRKFKNNSAFYVDSFVQTLIDDPDRGYSDSIIQVLLELRRQTEAEDHFAPAKRLFDGKGSQGNGGAMRIAPLAIYYYFERDIQFNV